MIENWPSHIKPKAEVEKQVEEVEDILGVKLRQESSSDDLHKLSIDEIKERYPERYNAYLRILRAKKGGQEIDESELLEMRMLITALNNLDSYISAHEENEGERVLRERQITVFDDIRNSLERGEKEGYIKLPTGVGKTVLFSQIVESLGLKTLIVVPSKVLVKQTGEKLEEFTDLEFGNYYQEEKDFSKLVTNITYNSLVTSVENGLIHPDDFGVLVLDEAHKALGEKRIETLEKFDCIKLGFTATPEYSKERHISNILEHEIHSMNIVEAVQEGLISRFKSILAFTETDLSNVTTQGTSGYNEKELEKAINNHSRNLSAVELYKTMFDGKSAIAYCGGLEHARAVKKLFNEQQISCRMISGQTPPEERKEILEQFKNGEIKVLCNARLLIEGFDEPRASVALNLHPTLSRVDAEQRAGRVLRLNENNPDKWAFVVDFVDRNAKKSPVTFPEVAETSEADEEEVVEVEEEEESEVFTDAPRISESRASRYPTINIEGLKVFVDPREVLRMSKDMADGREKKEFDFEKFKQEVQSKGVKGSSEYKKLAARNKWTAYDTLMGKPEWSGPADFFGREKFDFEKLKQEVQSKRVKSSREYIKLARQNKWIDYRTLGGKPEWKGLGDFLGRDSDEF
ncbi:MAG: DEAD/DEAH box helicase, partial [Patescibacteria group bacterium]